jgi:plastocyanin
MLRTTVLLVALVLLLPGTALSQGNDPGAVQVAARDNVFEPADVTIKRGETVTWTNTGQNFHTVTSGSECTPSGKFNAELPPGDQFSQTFEAAGVYPYYCVPHCSMGMTGTITVEEK